MKIIRKTNTDKNFYTLLGPFLAKRSVEREIGFRMYDDDDKTWFIALNVSKVLGFCYLQEKAAAQYHIGSCYVVKEYRRKGVFNSLLKEATNGISGTVHITTNNNIMSNLLLKLGFKKSGVKGSFVKYTKEIKNV